MRKIRKLLSLLLCCGLILSNCSQAVAASALRDGNGESEEARFLAQMAAGGSVTVSTPEQFEQALQNSRVTEIIVLNRITLCGTAESADYSISPVMIRGNVTVKGNGSGILTLRSPIQLTGDNVKFQDIEMNFISSGALGSVPHREIFLAGHTLTLDNVSCYTKGSDGSLGGFGGNEAELLPTVYAGGYRNTNVAAGAGLTIVNSNDKTNIQAIYAGHDGGKDNKTPYTGAMDIQIDARTAVRDGIFASANTGAVNITVSGQNVESCRTKYFEGNEKTTITFDNVSANRIPVKGGNIVLQDGAIYEPAAKGAAVIDSIEVQKGTTLNLSSMLGTVIKGDFKGGGTLILDKDDSLTINGTVSGATTFKTWSGSLAGIGGLTDGKAYITSTSENITGSITLDANYGSNYSLTQNDGVWTAKNNTPSQDREFGSFEVLSAPTFIDYDVVKEESLDQANIEPTQIFVTETRDKNGEVYVPDEFYTYVLRAEDVDKRDKTDWATDIFLMDLGNRDGYDFEGKYYIFFGTDDSTGDTLISGNVKPGKYQVFFARSDNHSTVGQIVDDAVGSAEFTIYKNEGTASKVIGDEHVSPVADQKYTGKEVKPSVQVTVDGAVLTEGTDYILNYENHKNVTSAASPAKVIVEGIGSYKGSVTREFQIVKGEAETKDALSVEKKDYAYGEIVKLNFTAVPRQDAGKRRMARSAQPDTADFYYGNTLLGSAPVVNGKAAFLYDTTKRQIPVGSADITVDFGGNDKLAPANFTEKGLFHIQKKKLEPSDIGAISLKDFVYDGTTMETEITGITWNDSTASDLSVEGTAELGAPTAGSYQRADIISLTLTGENSRWYDETALTGRRINVPVNPEAVIKKAESEGIRFETLIFNGNETSGSFAFDNTVIPDGFDLDAAESGDTTGHGQLLKNVDVKNDKVTFDLSDIVPEGDGTIHVILTFKNHADVHLKLKVIKTQKKVVNPVFRVPKMEYTGAGYDGWSVEGYSKDMVQATYYDLDEEKSLGLVPPTKAGNYSVTLRLDTGTELAEETIKFTIEKKKTVLQALDRQVKIGENPPDLNSPAEGVDYAFVSGKPNPNESVGLIKMAYAKTPDTAQTGTYEIQIGIVGNVNENYSVEMRNGQLEVTAETELPKLYQITVTGGHANVQNAKPGDTVTITAEEPAGKEFVRWNTKSAGVTLANAESVVTTFVMPANDVEVTAEFQDKNGSSGGTGDGSGGSSGGTEDGSGGSSGGTGDGPDSGSGTGDGSNHKPSEKPGAGGSPSTGDSSAPVLAGVTLLAAFAGILALLFYRRCKKI